MASAFVDNIKKTIRTQWLGIINNTSIINNIRITDYAKDISILLDTYDPTLFNTTENRNIQQWMRNLYNFLYNESFVVCRFKNTNWHAHRLWIMGKLGFIFKNPDIINILRIELKRYLQSSIMDTPDLGILIDTIHRDSISYHVYTLFAILNAVVILEKGFNMVVVINNKIEIQNVFPSDFSLRPIVQPAIDFLKPYTYNNLIHIEFINSNIQTDKTRSDYGKPFDIKNAQYLYLFMNNNNFN